MSHKSYAKSYRTKENILKIYVNQITIRSNRENCVVIRIFTKLNQFKYTENIFMFIT